MLDHVDVVRLVRDLEDLGRRIRALKRALRRTWTRPMASEQRQLVRLRRQVTRRCILRARMRGRHHLAGPPRDGWPEGRPWHPDDYHQRIAGEVAGEYAAAAAVGEVRA